MTDRELLELAARAAGLEIIPLAQEGRDKAGHGDVGLYVKHADGGVSTCWNPLKDDGDALRLAVRLCIQIAILSGPEVWAQFYRADEKVTGWITIKEPKGDDPLAATRRAIVRAAAALSQHQGETSG